MKKIYSKLLLFGEHTVVKGSQALAIPFKKFSGQWCFANPSKDQKGLQQNLAAFQAYLSNLENQSNPDAALNTQSFLNDLQKGLYFDANIPVGYGLGSSGALCAAVYARYADKPIKRTDTASFFKLKKILAEMESFFHGSSSGIDPLICYLAQSVIIQSNGEIEVVAMQQAAPKQEGSLFLFDTNISRQTGPLVQLFLKKCEDYYFEKRVISELIPANEAAIDHFLQNNWTALFEDFHEVSHFQFRYMPEMIPSAMRNIWLDGLSSHEFKLKICGAGGGGFLLGICADFPKLQDQISRAFPANRIVKIV